MELSELAKKCGEQIIAKNNHIYLTLPAKRGRRYRYMAGKKSPRGEIISWDENNRVLCSFDAFDVLAFCCANGVKYQIVTQPKGEAVNYD
jgi:hypothetical protein